LVLNYTANICPITLLYYSFSNAFLCEIWLWKPHLSYPYFLDCPFRGSQTSNLFSGKYTCPNWLTREWFLSSKHISTKTFPCHGFQHLNNLHKQVLQSRTTHSLKAQFQYRNLKKKVIRTYSNKQLHLSLPQASSIIFLFHQNFKYKRPSQPFNCTFPVHFYRLIFEHFPCKLLIFLTDYFYQNLLKRLIFIRLKFKQTLHSI